MNDIKQSTIKIKPKIQKKWVISGIIITLFGWWGYVNLMPHPLGDKLEYIGKSDYGCLLICDADPGSTYYYGTGMSPEEVVGYFRGADQPHSTQEMSDFELISLTSRADHSPIYIHYYNDKHKVQGINASRSNKNFILEIDANNYSRASAAL